MALADFNAGDARAPEGNFTVFHAPMDRVRSGQDYGGAGHGIQAQPPLLSLEDLLREGLVRESLKPFLKAGAHPLFAAISILERDIGLAWYLIEIGGPVH